MKTIKEIVSLLRGFDGVTVVTGRFLNEIDGEMDLAWFTDAYQHPTKLYEFYHIRIESALKDNSSCAGFRIIGTHNLDSIKAIYKVCCDTNRELRLVRVVLKGDDYICTVLSKDELRIALDNGIEMR